jgi:hypothetical protein
MGRAKKQRPARRRLCKNTIGAFAGGSRTRKSNSSSNPGIPAGKRMGASGRYATGPKYFVAISGIKRVVYLLQVICQNRLRPPADSRQSWCQPIPTSDRKQNKNRRRRNDSPAAGSVLRLIRFSDLFGYYWTQIMAPVWLVLPFMVTRIWTCEGVPDVQPPTVGVGTTALIW